MSFFSQFPNDQRLAALHGWLTGLALIDVASARPASADASFRRYFRVDVAAAHRATLGATLIVMDAPPEREKVLAHDNASALYADALGALLQFQLTSAPGVLPEYDRAFLLRELQLFPEWYIGRHLGATLSDKQTAELDGVFDAILAVVTAQQQVYVHRDFHSRNLMRMDAANPGVLDFQDALYGPVTYDAASLLRDAYIQWDEELVLDWLVRYWQDAKAAGLPVNPDIDGFYRDFEFTALQRHLKILGIFCRLNYRDGKGAFLGAVATVLDYVRKTAGRYRELKPLLRLLDALDGIAPAVGYTF